MAKLTESQIDALSAQAPGWVVIEEDGMRRLHRTFEFGNFADALAFTNTVGGLAEAEGHHPRIVTEWGRVTVTWWTHSEGGLTAGDFAMAAKTGRLLKG